MPSPLADRIADQIRAEGPIAFSEYMRAALYDPEDGYYADPAFTTGREGDFATAPDTGPLMGATLAGAIEDFAEAGSTLVELGPGSGRLITDILENVSQTARERLEVVLVEPFAPRRQALADRVEQTTGVRARVEGDLGPVDSGRCFLLANEVLDALPVDVLRKRGDEIEVMHVDLDVDGQVAVEEGGEESRDIDADGKAADGEQAGFVETWRPANPELVDQVRPVVDRLPEGGHYEYAHGLQTLLEAVSQTLEPGVAMFFDYGSRFEDRWGQGTETTLRGFREHQHADVLEDPGQVDLTADVDFSRLRGLADALGLEEAAYGGQDRLLVHLGMVEIAQERDRLQDVKQLLVPRRASGFGERFQTLVLDKGGVGQTLGLEVDLEDPDLWARAMEDLSGAEGLAGLGSEELF